MPRLILLHPTFIHPSCELSDGTWTVGRSCSKNRIIMQHESVSGDHCELLVWGREVIVRERSSRNGTFVDGVRVKAQSSIGHGQSLRIGSVEARIEISPPVDEGATSITAMDSYRHAVSCENAPALPAAKPPFTFVLVGEQPDTGKGKC